MQVAYIQTDSVIPNPENPRVHPATQIQKLAASIAEWGFNSPVVVNKAMMLLAGHGRLEAAKLLGLEKIPALIVTDLAEVEQAAYAIADNKLSDLAGWDMNMLSQELAEIAKDSFQDLKLTGFEPDELKGLLDGLTPDLVDMGQDSPKEKDDSVACKVGIYTFKVTQEQYWGWKNQLQVDSREEVVQIILSRLLTPTSTSEK